HSILHSFPTRRSSDLFLLGENRAARTRQPGAANEAGGRCGAPGKECAGGARVLARSAIGNYQGLFVRCAESLGPRAKVGTAGTRSEEHTSELQSPCIS